MFYCQSELASKRWLSLDLAGVSVGMCGCYFPGAYYAFYCDVVSCDNDIVHVQGWIYYLGSGIITSFSLS